MMLHDKEVKFKTAGVADGKAEKVGTIRSP